MALASRGQGLSSFVGRQSSHAIPGARSIHVFAPRPSSAVTEAGGIGNAERLIKHTRNFVTRFFTHLTTPGFSHPIAGTTRPLVSTGFNAARQPSIHQNLSFTARHGLSQGFGPRFIPKPAAVPGSMVNVGLGTARNFSTARPLFQHIAENVPIAGRTMYNSDVDLRKRALGKKRIMKTKKEEKENLKASSWKTLESMKRIVVDEKTTEEEELEHYFPTSSAPSVTTYLSIPMAPTPTSRYPLPTTSSSSAHPLLPISELSTILASHHRHSISISSLFMRLDAANVWDKGVTCHAYGESSGMCTVLRVEFAGWTREMVKGVIGEAGMGWCIIEEVRDEEISNAASFARSRRRDSRVERIDSIDPAATMILPTLSFSSSMLAATDHNSIHSTPPSPPDSLSGMSDVSSLSDLSNDDLRSLDGDMESVDTNMDWDTPSEGSWISTGYDSPMERMSGNGNSLNWGGLSLSSEFSNRMETAQRGNGSGSTI